MQSSSRKSSQTWFVAFPRASLLFLLRQADSSLFFSSFWQIENSFSLSVPIFKQFHKNIIGKGGANIKKVRFPVFMLLFVHNRHAALKGRRFRQIREETNTKIDLPTENSNSEMIVITGKKGNCEAARERILGIQRELVRERRSQPTDGNASHLPR